jgi:hypothetical protein
MAKNFTVPPLHVVEPEGGPQPARALGQHGMALWSRVNAEYRIADVAGIELLTHACQAVDRAEMLAAYVAAHGAIIKTKTGIKAHPAIREELACRGFAVRTLMRLGINFEPLHVGPGRPPGS